MNSLAQIKWASGDWDGALAGYERAVELCERIGEVEGLFQAHVNLGVLYTNRGEWVKAGENLNRSLDIARRTLQAYELAQAHVSLGQLHMMQERWDDCSQYLDAAMTMYTEAGTRAETDLSQVYGLQAVLSLARDQIDDARQWAERAGSLLRKVSGTEDGDSIEWGRYEQLMGRIALAGNDLEAARRHFKRSAAIFQGRGAQLETGRVAYWSGLLLLAQRQKKKAREELGRAKKTFARLGAAADLQRVEQRLAGT